MKLSIQCSVVTDLQQKIKDSPKAIYCFRFGNMLRDGFTPFLHPLHRKKIYEDLVHLPATLVHRSVSIFKKTCDIGYISGYWIHMGVCSTFTDKLYPVLVCSTYSVCFLDDYIQIEMKEFGCSLEELMQPLKVVCSLIGDILVPTENRECIILKEPKPFSTGIHAGQWSSLMVQGSEAHLVLPDMRTFLINCKIPYPIDKSLFHGYWHRNIFTVVDATGVQGVDVRAKSIRRRLILAKRCLLGLEFCKISGLSRDNKVSFSCYEISMIFRVAPVSLSGFTLFKLINHNNEVFSGTKEYPYDSPVPFSSEDREFMEKFYPHDIFEFRWENNNLVPYAAAIIFHSLNNWNFLHHRKDPFKNTGMSPKALTMASQRQLRMLPVNKSVVFFSPVEGEDVLVRTGTIGEGSCLFHALLHAYSKDYATMNGKGRMKFVRRLRASMAGKVNQESWEEMGGGVISKVPFQENVHNTLHGFYKYLESGETRGRSVRRVVKKLDESIEICKLIIELIPFHTMSSNCLPKAYSKTEDEKIDTCSEVVVKETLDYLKDCNEIKKLGQERVEYIQAKTKEMLSTILTEAKNSAYRTYVKGLERVSEDVDTYTIEFISERFNRDIYFLDGTSRLPYNTFPTDKNIKGRKSMILLWIGGNHYEIVGRLLPGNRIQREFPADDELVNRVRTFVSQPEKIQELYPDLSEYLPRDHRMSSPTRRSVKRTDSDEQPNFDGEDSGSDPYYDPSDASSDSAIGSDSD